MTRVIPNRFASAKCSVCKLPIGTGELMNWEKPDSGSKSRVWHQSCPNPSDATPPEPEVTINPEPKTLQSNGELMAQFAAAIQPFIGNTANMREEILAMVEERLANVQTVEHVVTVKQPNGEARTIEGRQHKLFPRLLDLLLNGDHVYLFGEPGSGKSTAGIKAAEALGMTHGYISLTPQSPKSELFGFRNGMTGEYVETEFYRCYRDGGVFVIDEMDNGSSQLLVALNSALENGTCAFPCGMVPKHEKFILVATGNTTGMGASRMFPNRQPMDGAFRERFLFMHWDTDADLERYIALSINPDAKNWIDWVQTLRVYCKQHHPTLLVTQRASIKGAKLLGNGFAPKDVADMAIFKGFDVDSEKSILAKFPIPA